ncbi:thioredoxin [bacterium]|nr:thioredoxin [bacterium]
MVMASGMQESWVIDVTDQTFEREVVERSRKVPVVVDFWAPWCGPCKTLGPLLEKLAAESRGAFVLAKVNVDENPMVARAAGVQSIPLVVALRDGQIVSEFVGAQPAATVQKFIQSVIGVDETAQWLDDAEKLAATDPASAERAYRAVLVKKPGHPKASLGLARLLAAAGRTDQAKAVLQTAQADPDSPEAEMIATALRALAAAAAVSPAEEQALRDKIAADPGDLASRIALGKLLAAGQRWDDALAELLEAVKRNRDFDEGAARKAMLDVFALLGRDNPVTSRYQRELSTVLFR